MSQEFRGEYRYQCDNCGKTTGWFLAPDPPRGWVALRELDLFGINRETHRCNECKEEREKIT